MSTLTIICAWCGTALGSKDGNGAAGETSGICEACLATHFPEEATEAA